MTTSNVDNDINNDEEIVLTEQTAEQWRRRRRELDTWVNRDKLGRLPKQTMMLDQVAVDAQLHKALTIFKEQQIQTEFSCAGVSILDEPEDHSLYAYITFLASEQTERFIALAKQQMKHRLLVVFEPGRKRYDLSSFLIGHNRSFCLQIEHCAELYKLEQG
ncbi:hypothetical protein [Paenibacillus agricola]|uniref:Uncharacterized protein n=1 Tax=Paenibacillus agricola TaxID=2716264 RepID=A0ABX0J9K8_9BACL|nr:hypothetical protein [Paenibacillus agricola]NHN30849.1 hypothetical protein [Paenibacillus agricola]